MTRICGIYCIENTLNKKKYIGKSVNCIERMKQHRRDLRRGEHSNEYLQRSFDKNGEENFTFYVLEECSSLNLDEREIFFIDYFESKRDKKGFNIENGGIGGTDRIDVSTKRKISDSQRGIRKQKNKKMNSVFVGTAWKSGFWEAAIGSEIGNTQIYLGRYVEEKDAALAYDKKALELFGKTYNFEVQYVIDTELPIRTYQSEYLGVSPRYDNRRGHRLSCWRMRIEMNKEKVRLDFPTEILVAQNYDIFVIYSQRKNLRLNFPDLLPVYNDIISSNSFPIREEIFYE